MRNIRSLLACLIISLFYGCELSNINVDPTRPSKVKLEQQLPIALVQTAKNQSGIAARASAGFVQYFEGIGCWPNYYMPPNTLDLFWSEGVYAGALKDAQNIVAQASEEDQAHYRGIARILMAENYGMLASMFGEVPFSEALLGNEILQPKYDTQKELYAGVQDLLDLAIIDLMKPKQEGGPGLDDLVYGGSQDAWIACAYALKARYAMHLSRRDKDAATKALEWINNGAFTDITQQANFDWKKEDGAENPLADYGISRPNTMLIDPAFHEMMENKTDPRLQHYMHFDGQNWQYFVPNMNLRWSSPNAIIPIISYAELMFLKAEALLYTGSTNADIEEALKLAIRANMEDVGVAETEIEPYINQWGQLPVNSEEAAKLAHIMDETYIAYFGMGFNQIWTNYRRTGYPALSPLSNSQNSFNPSGIIPRRFLYPEVEQTTNYSHWQEASMRQGGALLDADTWAFADY